MRVQNKQMYAFLTCIFDENSHTCPTRTRIKQSGLINAFRADSIKQSGCTLFRHTRSELNSRTLSRRLAVCAAISAWQTPEEMPETLL